MCPVCVIMLDSISYAIKNQSVASSWPSISKYRRTCYFLCNEILCNSKNTGLCGEDHMMLETVTPSLKVVTIPVYNAK